MTTRLPRLQRWHDEITKLNPELKIFDVAVGLSSQCSNAKADCFWIASSDSLRWSGVHEDFQWAMQYQLSLAGWHRRPRSPQQLPTPAVCAACSSASRGPPTTPC